MRLRKSQTYRAESITLRRSDLGEADRILTLYTREHGKRRAVAKSVRRPQSRLAGHIELFTHAEVFLAVGTNLDVLTQATAIEVFPAIADDLARFARASWAAELVDRLTPEEEADPQLFAHLLETIRLLAGDQGHEPVHLRQFEILALKTLGYRPHLDSCVECGRELEERPNIFSPTAGGVICPSCTPPNAALRISPAALKVMRWMGAQTMGAGSRLRISEELEVELERLHTAYLTEILGGGMRSASLTRSRASAARKNSGLTFGRAPRHRTEEDNGRNH